MEKIPKWFWKVIGILFALLFITTIGEEIIKGLFF